MTAKSVRISRATNDLDQVLRFYADALELEVLGSFTDHAGFDGVILGRRGDSVHFEFTHQRGLTVGRAPTKENLFVFYLPDEREWAERVQRMIHKGFQPVATHNPYWEIKGKTFEDFEGYRVVLLNEGWMP